MMIQLMDCERTILEEIKNKQARQKDVAVTYAFCILSDEDIDWNRIHHAILDRWSMSGLNKIKKIAHNMINYTYMIEKRRRGD